MGKICVILVCRENSSYLSSSLMWVSMMHISNEVWDIDGKQKCYLGALVGPIEMQFRTLECGSKILHFMHKTTIIFVCIALRSCQFRDHSWQGSVDQTEYCNWTLVAACKTSTLPPVLSFLPQPFSFE